MCGGCLPFKYAEVGGGPLDLVLRVGKELGKVCGLNAVGVVRMIQLYLLGLDTGEVEDERDNLKTGVAIVGGVNRV
jgi:hypothetical protein